MKNRHGTLGRLFYESQIDIRKQLRCYMVPAFEKKEKVEFVNLVSAPRHRKIILRKINK